MTSGARHRGRAVSPTGALILTAYIQSVYDIVMDSIDGDKLRGHLETLILATLDRGGEAHGLEILRRLEAGGSGILKLKEGSLYPALYRLEAAGEIQGAWEKEPHGRRGP